jgi:hypothetical protein
MAAFARWWPLTGLAFVGLFIGCFALTDGSPGNDSSTAKILSYYAKDSNQARDIIGMLMIVAAVLFFIWFLTGLRARLQRAEGAGGTLTTLAYGSGIAAGTLWVAAAALFSAPAFALDEGGSKYTLDPDTFRLVSTLGWTVWIGGTMIASLTVFAIGLLALRAGLLPKWLAWASLLVAVTLLFAILWIPFLILCGWVLVVSVTLLTRSAAPEAAAVPVS